MTTTRAVWRANPRAAILLTVAVSLCTLTAASGQTIIFERGQNVVPAFE